MDKPQTVIGRAERIALPEFGMDAVPVRIDTGAKTSAVWASNITETDGTLEYSLFGEGSEFYTGNLIRTKVYGERLVANSTGHIERRYTVKMLVILEGRKVNATFTLANRASQVYPVLIGRNILRGKFIVNVKLGTPLTAQEKLREIQKSAALAGNSPKLTSGKDMDNA